LEFGGHDGRQSPQWRERAGQGLLPGDPAQGVGFVLTPAQRYPNKDTKATLILAGDKITESPAPGGADENDGGQGGGSLAFTGVDGGTLLIGGTGLIAVGTLLLLGMTRRRRVTLS
jgi:hypothetical protein